MDGYGYLHNIRVKIHKIWQAIEDNIVYETSELIQGQVTLSPQTNGCLLSEPKICQVYIHSSTYNLLLLYRNIREINSGYFVDPRVLDLTPQTRA